MNPWIPDGEKYFSNICCKRYGFWCMRRWTALTVEVLIHRPSSSVTLSAELKELYVHKTNGGFTRWLPWKMAAPEAYFFQAKRGGWWMLGNGDFWARSSSPTGEIFSRYSSRPGDGYDHPHRKDSHPHATFLCHLRAQGNPKTITLRLGCANKAGYENNASIIFQCISDDLSWFCDLFSSILFKWKLKFYIISRFKLECQIILLNSNFFYRQGLLFYLYLQTS